MAMGSSSSSSADPSPPLPPPTPSNPSPPIPPNPPKPSSFPAPSTTSPQPPKSPNPPPISFPVAASGRAFPPKPVVRSSSPPSDQIVTVANPIGYPVPPGRSPAVAGLPPQGRPFGFHPDPLQSAHAMRPPSRHLGSMSSGALRGVPAASSSSHPRVPQFPAFSSTYDYNYFKDLRDKSRDDTVVTIHDRKVRLSDAGSGSLYSLCRSWVHNGLPQDNLPQVGEGIRLLPRPFPANVAHTSKKSKAQVDAEDESASKEEHDGLVDNLSARELLEGHIKRAKKIRTRLTEERLRRIDRYRQRLALLLPSSSVEQCRSDVATSS